MNKRKFLPTVTGAILLFVGIGAAAGGLGAILDPSGESMGVQLALLENSPFENYLIPAIFLFFVNGIGSLMVSYLAFKNYRYAGMLTMILGFILVLWILAQLYWLSGVNWLHYAFLGIGLLEMILGFLFHMRRNGYTLFRNHPRSHAH
ncbi:hypothetical protein [Bacillus tuaregi]|uniref:hypothetical protein n=1 Tax=Bacillus tuaregi TaxID=1816695 RepID=UPI0008F8A948|nr:hypothetical protein [Bacillus tuaregi]